MGCLKRSHKARRASIARARERRAEISSRKEEDDDELREVEAVLQSLIEKVAIEEEESAEIEEEVVNEEIDEPHNDPNFFDLTVAEDSGIENSEIDNFLVWNSETATSFCLRGDSRRSQFRKRQLLKEREESVAKCRKIDYYFSCTVLNAVDCDNKLEDTDDSQRMRFTTYQEAINDLIPVTQVTVNKSWDHTIKANLSIFQFNQLKAVRAYLTLLDKGEGKYPASAKVAKSHFSTDAENPNCYRARCVRHWGTQYMMFGCVVQSGQGRHIKTNSIIADENFQLRLKEVLRSMEEVRRRPINFMNLLNTEILKDFNNAPNKISENTARRWMKILGYKLVNIKKDYYVDGHEREDVVEYRQQFLQRIEGIETRMKNLKWMKVHLLVDSLRRGVSLLSNQLEPISIVP
eukprot:gene15275-17077_t